ncbi:MAG TPA: thiolase family protein [Chloroflexota bacterium]|nr:thiolase family protein [Chloroflexota bacterium]
MSEAVIVSAVRTPFGRARKGRLVDIRADDLAAIAIRGALARVPALDLALVEDVILGCAFPEGEQGFNLARPASALAGIPNTAGGVTVNRFCASALQALNMAAQAIGQGAQDVVVAAGVESMTRVPMGGFNPSYHPKLAQPAAGYPCAYVPMGITAENVAERYGVSREEQDAFALRSHHRALAARDAGRFTEVLAITLPDGSVVDRDEGPRRDTSAERLAALEPAFIKGGTVTAGNSSPLTDGATAAVLMSAERARDLGLTPLARVRAIAVAGVDPEVMGIGPIPATRKALARAGMTMSDVDAVHLNEAFASQSIVVQRELGIPEDRLNVHGGAIAIGHPLGCSGIRLVAQLLSELTAVDGTIGIATLCVGGGQGVATIIERL